MQLFAVDLFGHLGEVARVSQPSPRRVFSPLMLCLVTIAVAIAVPYGFIPYSAGYTDKRLSVFGFAWEMWTKVEDWQHCMFVPLAAGLLVYLNRKELARLPIRGAWVGLPLIFVGLFLFWFGFEADVVYFGYASMQIVLAGLIIFLLGWRWMGALAFPWLFLAFMWPLLFLDNMVAFPLRIIMSKASVVVLNLVGVPTTLSGTAILSSPDALTNRPMGKLFSVDVAEPCSGIRSLFALMMVSALYGYFSVQGWWRRWIIFLSSIPLAILGNLCRIVMLTFGTIALGSDIAIGKTEHPSFFHMLSGYVVFAVALVGMLGVSKLLNMDWGELTHRMKMPPPPPAAPQVPAGQKPAPAQDVY